MLDFFRSLFETDFMPHLYCLRGDPGVLWLQVLSDLAIAIAYYAIPIVLLRVVLKRKEAIFRRVAVLFVLFIAACGTTHVLEIWTIWHPMYRLEGVVKAVTAVLSILTALVLVRLRSRILQMPGIAEIEKEIKERRRAETVALANEERLRLLGESVEDYAIYMLDVNGMVQTWNKGAERIKGYTAAEIAGKHFSLFYTPEDRSKKLPEAVIRAVAEHGGYEGVGWRVRKDGSRFWAKTALRPMRDASGTLRGFSKVTRDLTESQEMESKYQMLLEAAPDAILIVNRQGRIDFVNQRMEELFGYSRAEIVGKSVDLLLPERFRAAHGSHRSEFFEAPVSREMGAGRELSGLRRDGSEFSVEISLSPLETRDGPVALAAVRDVTKRKKAEMRFRDLLESAPDAMVIVNSEGFIELSNLQTEKLFGYSRLELVGQSVDILVPLDLRGAHGGHRGHFFEAPKKREMGADLDLMALRKDGTEFPVEISLSPLEGPDGISVTAVIRDISERKLAARQLAEKMLELRHSNEALEQFAHIASHDLQEPLRMVASYTQLLSKRYKGRLDADADEFIGFAVDGTQRMKRLIEDLLLYSRAGKGLPPSAKFSTESALQEAINNLTFAIRDSQAVVTHDAMPRLEGVESGIVQVFQNLIGNAIKYRGDRTPEVHVSAALAGGEWIFSVADNGIGIDPKCFDRIFIIFQRLHGREEYQGTGIGLAICKRILQQQGGRIWVESESAKGSVFHFSLSQR
jgi:PAS domain S-box-containing protein